jgi:hypothetical protein
LKQNLKYKKGPKTALLNFFREREREREEGRKRRKRGVTSESLM